MGGTQSLNLAHYHRASLPPNQENNASIKVVSLDEILGVLDRLFATGEGLAKILDSQKKAYEAVSNGGCTLCPVQTLGQPGPPVAHHLQAGQGAQVCIKTGYYKPDEGNSAEEDVFVTKVAGGGGDQPGNVGMLLVFSQRTMKIKTILNDEGILTEVRTAAATVLASELLCDFHSVEKVGIVGTGIQAIWQLRLLNLKFKQLGLPLPEVIVKWACRRGHKQFQPLKVMIFIQETMGKSACPLDREWAAGGRLSLFQPDGERFRGCRLIHTLTAGRSPQLAPEDLPGDLTGCHLSCVGADAPGKRELPAALVASELHPPTLVCDSLAQSLERGEFQHHPALFRAGRVRELGTVLGAGRDERARLREAFTIFDTSGVATQDVGIAQLVAGLVP